MIQENLWRRSKRLHEVQDVSLPVQLIIALVKLCQSFLKNWKPQTSLCIQEVSTERLSLAVDGH